MIIGDRLGMPFAFRMEFLRIVHEFRVLEQDTHLRSTDYVHFDKQQKLESKPAPKANIRCYRS